MFVARLWVEMKMKSFECLVGVFEKYPVIIDGLIHSTKMLGTKLCWEILASQRGSASQGVEGALKLERGPPVP